MADLKIELFRKVLANSKYFPGIISTLSVLELTGVHYEIPLLMYLEYINGFGLVPLFCFFYYSLAVGLCTCQRIHLVFAFLVGLYTKLICNSIIYDFAIVSNVIIVTQVLLLLLINWRHYVSKVLHIIIEKIEKGDIGSVPMKVLITILSHTKRGKDAGLK